MKKCLLSLIVSGSVGVMFTSAIVLAQVPVNPRTAGPDQKSAELKRETKIEKKAALKVEGVVIKKVPNAFAGAAVVRAGNVEAFAQQNIRQGRPTMRAEVIFVRKLFGLNTEQLRRIYQDAETATQGGGHELCGESAETTCAHRRAGTNRPRRPKPRWGKGFRAGFRSGHEETPHTGAIQPL